ncbi:uncharacterized protein LOC5504014 isoform X2 [Nematostella vectensis]|uniref:uncharacterized protein LOC5504014 isoform X2 n=1 Tax=Nematostella vectensis TaxID=45351 RepID=UPI00207700E0|nr:uncharacterized protein LOC5504014 isoform X2 [Nematostella vectensis]
MANKARLQSILLHFIFNMAEGKRAPKKKKLTEAELFLELGSTLKTKKRKKASKPYFMKFQRDPVSGRRTFKTPYRSVPRTNRTDASISAEEFTYMEDEAESMEATDTLDSIIKDTEEILESWKQERLKKAWSKRMQAVNISWETSRKLLFSVCHGKNSIIRCQDCVHNFLCQSCDDFVHTTSPLHDREAILGRFDSSIVSHYACSVCSTEVDCSITAVDVIRNGYWPGTPTNICHIFSQDLFLFWDQLQERMPGVSERALMSSLEDYSKEKGRIRNNFQIELSNFAYRLEQSISQHSAGASRSGSSVAMKSTSLLREIGWSALPARRDNTLHMLMAT